VLPFITNFLSLNSREAAKHFEATHLRNLPPLLLDSLSDASIDYEFL
jgi:hypothetical protein